MKKHKSIYFSFLVSMMISLAGFSQEHEPRYLLSGGEKDVKVSGFTTVFNQFSGLQGDFAYSIGGGGALIFNQGFFIGGYGQGVATRHDYKELRIYNENNKSGDPDVDQNLNKIYDNLKLTMGHGGFWLGYNFKSHNVFHLMADTKLGWGSVNLSDRYYHTDKNEDLVYDPVFVIIPEIGGELNLLKWFKINFTIGYRFVTGLNKEYEYNPSPTGEPIEKKYFDAADFNGIEGSINLVFGWFHQ